MERRRKFVQLVEGANKWPTLCQSYFADFFNPILLINFIISLFKLVFNGDPDDGKIENDGNQCKGRFGECHPYFWSRSHDSF
jgi:hypothetical protein